MVVQGRKFDMTNFSHDAAFDMIDMPPVNEQIPIMSATNEDDVFLLVQVEKKWHPNKWA